MSTAYKISYDAFHHYKENKIDLVNFILLIVVEGIVTYLVSRRHALHLFLTIFKHIEYWAKPVR
jgi:hypothetical protein